MLEQIMQNSETSREVGKLFGKYPGRVLDNNPAGNGKHRGELLVEIAGLLEETPDGAGQQPMQVHALPCFPPGFFFIPEIDARVWIEFAAGDINTPLWTGVWYPVDKTPKTFDGQNPTLAQKIIRTASGHVIQIDDTEKEEKIVIRHKDGQTTLELKKDEVNITAKTIILNGETTITENTYIQKDLEVGSGPKTTISGNKITGG